MVYGHEERLVFSKSSKLELIMNLQFFKTELVRHCTPKPVIISYIRLSPTGSNFFAVVQSFDAKNAISATLNKL